MRWLRWARRALHAFSGAYWCLFAGANAAIGDGLDAVMGAALASLMAFFFIAAERADNAIKRARRRESIRRLEADLGYDDTVNDYLAVLNEYRRLAAIGWHADDGWRVRKREESE